MTTIMTTYFLRFTDEAAADTALEAAGFLQRDPEGNTRLIRDTHEYSLDPVGVIYNDDAVINFETGEVLTPATPKDGWHVNLKGTLPDGWDQYQVSPAQPYRVFAGD